MSENVVTTTIVPAAGGIVATILFGSSIGAVRAAKARGDIGALNPLPFVFIIANCVSWITYSFITDDWFLYVPNTIGFLLGLFFFLSTFGLISSQRQRDQLITVAMTLATLLPLVACAERLILTENDDRKLLWGYTANGILLCFYSSPLTSMAQVLRMRDASSLTLPLSVMNVINGSLWFVYGLVLGDAFIWVPNGVGAVLGVLQTTLCIIFPSKMTKMQRAQSQVALQPNADHAQHVEQVPLPSSAEDLGMNIRTASLHCDDVQVGT